jgi:uncharacterized protein YjbI with pentapeptide repeats
MRRLKRDLWKAGITIAGMLLFLVLMAWIPVSAAGAEVRASGLAAMVTVQATPTEDATVTALNKEKLAQEVQQLKNQNEPTFFDWLRGNVSILLLGLGALAGFLRWLADRRDAQGKELADRKAERERRDEEQQRWLKNQEAEREKRAEERFQSAVTGLGDERESAKIGAAILLRTFLHPGYEQFYIQTFDLAVAHLCPTRTSHPPEDPKTSLPLTILRQALIVAFKEAFPLVRSQNTGSPQSLDASYIQLDNAYLVRADLKQVWMPQASCREANLSEADLSRANLGRAKLNGANLSGAKLKQANLAVANLNRTDLAWADFTWAELSGANLSGANLNEAELNGAYLDGVELSGAYLSGANIEYALSLKDANLREVKGPTKKQLEACKAKGAIIDEDPTTSPPKPTVAPSPPSQNNDAQTPSAPAAQGNTPTPETGESSAPSSKPGPQS